MTLETKLKMRPYARLLTMLGDQLIKDSRTALVELTKNAYDADATFVEISFENFGDDLSVQENSLIRITDNGSGMTPEIIKRSWMNPATPEKLKAKQAGKNRTPIHGRTVQGEKGIGRFAIFKLGKNVTIATKTKSAKHESQLRYDFSAYDDDFMTCDEEEQEIYLDDIEITYSDEVAASNGMLKTDSGLEIMVQDLKSGWNKSVLEKLIWDLNSLVDPVSRMAGKKETGDFDILISVNGEPQLIEDESQKELQELLEHKAVFEIDGEFDEKKEKFVYCLCEDGEEKEIPLSSEKLQGLWLWRRKWETASQSKCGSFKFRFFIFDLSLSQEELKGLSRPDKNVIKRHRVYLYRDNARVYPYGDPDDDWLSIDIYRGVGKAGASFSNDQLVGWVEITHKHNEKLKDKTNREGLLGIDGAEERFKFLIALFLSYIREHPYAQYREKLKMRNKLIGVMGPMGEVGKLVGGVIVLLDGKGMKKESRRLQQAENLYKKEIAFFQKRAEVTEDLAGVGLAVETSSHDIMLILGRAVEQADEIRKFAKNLGNEDIMQRSDRLYKLILHIEESISSIQCLFRSSVRRSRQLPIEKVLDDVSGIYRDIMDKRNISYHKEILGKEALKAKTYDGLILQVLINLFDNACYWLNVSGDKNREIKVTLDGSNETLIFSDNGCGIDKDDAPYVFEVFYSGKGEAGRGLGLYIARQLLTRHGFSIKIADQESDRILPGANFVIEFKEK